MNQCVFTGQVFQSYIAIPHKWSFLAGAIGILSNRILFWAIELHLCNNLSWGFKTKVVNLSHLHFSSLHITWMFPIQNINPVIKYWMSTRRRPKFLTIQWDYGIILIWFFQILAIFVHTFKTIKWTVFRPCLCRCGRQGRVRLMRPLLGTSMPIGSLTSLTKRDLRRTFSWENETESGRLIHQEVLIFFRRIARHGVEICDLSRCDGTSRKLNIVTPSSSLCTSLLSLISFPIWI